MTRKIIGALLKPGRKLGLDDPAKRRALTQKKEERTSPITIPVTMARIALGVFMILSIAVTALAVSQEIREWKPDTPVTAIFETDFSINVLNKLTGMAPGAVFLLPLLTYLAAIAGGLIVGTYQSAFRAAYNFVDRALGQKAMVEKATAEGIEIGKAEGIALGIAQERARWTRNQGRGANPDA